MHQKALLAIIVIIIFVIILVILASPSCSRWVANARAKKGIKVEKSQPPKVEKSQQRVEEEQAERENAARKIREAHKPKQQEPNKNIFPTKPILQQPRPPIQASEFISNKVTPPRQPVTQPAPQATPQEAPRRRSAAQPAPQSAPQTVPRRSVAQSTPQEAPQTAPQSAPRRSPAQAKAQEVPQAAPQTAPQETPKRRAVAQQKSQEAPKNTPNKSPNKSPKAASEQKVTQEQTPDLTIPERIPVLKGPVEDLFNYKPNQAAKFGLTEEQLDEMARKYHAEHLADKKPTQIRNRANMRRDAQRAEDRLRSSFVAMASNKTVRNTDFVSDTMQKKILSGNSESRKTIKHGMKIPNN
jgi:biopolymer transport protein ExbB/TolQ